MCSIRTNAYSGWMDALLAWVLCSAHCSFAMRPVAHSLTRQDSLVPLPPPAWLSAFTAPGSPSWSIPSGSPDSSSFDAPFQSHPMTSPSLSFYPSDLLTASLLTTDPARFSALQMSAQLHFTPPAFVASKPAQMPPPQASPALIPPKDAPVSMMPPPDPESVAECCP